MTTEGIETTYRATLTLPELRRFFVDFYEVRKIRSLVQFNVLPTGFKPDIFHVDLETTTITHAEHLNTAFEEGLLYAQGWHKKFKKI